MTDLQYTRWREFATKLAHHGWPNATEARKKKIAAACEDFIDWYADCKETVSSWDGNEHGVYVCDDLSTFLYDNFHVPELEVDKQTRMEMQVSCCVRAGLDMASEPSFGVVGFTVGTLRAMYNGTIPHWITKEYEEALNDLDDDRPIWL